VLPSADFFCRGSFEIQLKLGFADSKLVDQPEYGKNTTYLVDFIRITFATKLLNVEEIRRLYTAEGLSTYQIARRFRVAKSVIVSRLHDVGIRPGHGFNRSNNPENYRCRVPPYGFVIKEGRLVPCRSELRICRLVVELMGRKQWSANATARELGIKNYKNRSGSTRWDHSSVIAIFKKWNGKL